MANKRLLGTIALLFAVTLSMAQGAHSFKVSEVMVANTNGLLDEYGQRSAWIEIANTSWGTNSVGSCYLTTDRRALNENLSVPERVKLMSLIPRGDSRTTLTAKQHIVFFADGKTNLGTLHTNFVLTLGHPNFVALFDGNGKTLLDSITVPASVKVNQSYARFFNSATDTVEWKVLPVGSETPNVDNSFKSKHEDKVAEFKEKDPYGIGMSVIAMSIVFCCLILLYAFFRIFGQVVSTIERVNRHKAVVTTRAMAHKAAVIAKQGLETKGVDNEVYAVVIALALHQFENEVHDVESGRITIASKPTQWNNKGQNMLRSPEKK